jgi:type VI secretion system Hcp family effector
VRPIDPYPAPGLAPKTGRPGRKLSPGPIGIVKRFDRATPKLLQALATHEALNVEIDFYEPDPQGTAAEILFYRLILTNAIVTEIHSADDAQSAPREKVVFAWERLKSIDLLNGVEFEITPR